jgi:hypothetical protein
VAVAAAVGGRSVVLLKHCFPLDTSVMMQLLVTHSVAMVQKV